MKYLTLTLFALGLVFSVSAQSKMKKDAEAIKNMCGCFEVTFNFAETFNYSKDSLYKPSKNKIAKALEWAQLIEDKKGKIAIQHILQMGSPDEPYIIKHWRQDWIYENQDFYIYESNNKWIYKKKSKEDVKNQWTQKVYQVDDSPRYEGSSSWVHVDGKSYWENTTDAPLPRREYTIRSDYNVTVRGNRHEITSSGWIHDQDNKKLIRKADTEDFIIAKEKGYNVYKRLDDTDCAGAIKWWGDNKMKWSIVRNKWDQVFALNDNLLLEKKVNNKPLYKYLFSEEYKEEQEINDIIKAFIKK
ncbi:MAG: hypothetical protein EVA43_03545 [Flavobacteriales bacterium]|nr:MAG: hypothetical protein EVA43_03545 [Flavobacteriales bacterium]